jgi:hypothetical protein
LFELKAGFRTQTALLPLKEELLMENRDGSGNQDLSGFANGLELESNATAPPIAESDEALLPPYLAKTEQNSMFTFEKEMDDRELM